MEQVTSMAGGGNEGTDTATEVVATGTINTEGTAIATEAEKAATEAPKIEEKKQEDRFSAKFAALSRKEKQLREKERQVEARMKQIEDQLKTKETEYTQKYIDPARFKKEPLKVLEEAGLTFEQLAEMAINNGKPTTEMVAGELEKKLLSEIDSLKKRLDEKETKETEAKYEQTLQNFVKDITKFVNDNNDYELIRANDAVDLVYEVIEEHYTDTQEVMTIKDAADAVENHLLEEAKKHISLNKIKGLFSPKEESKEATTEKRQSVTLSNTAASAVPKNGARVVTSEESKQEAAKLIRWEE